MLYLYYGIGPEAIHVFRSRAGTGSVGDGRTSSSSPPAENADMMSSLENCLFGKMHLWERAV